MNFFQQLAEMKGFAFCRPVWEISLYGSHERALFRVPVQTDKGLFVLERFPNESFSRKKAIADILHQLKKYDVPHVLPPLGNSGEESLFFYENTPCQMTPYISGIPLPRPSYVDEAWRGVALADFLHALRQKESFVQDSMPDFNLLRFGRKFLLTMQKYDVNLYEQIIPYWQLVEEKLGAVYETLPHVFCHGDLHCMNAIWGENDLLFVIDWEFCGIKTENYDIANFLGCVGMEDPQALDGALVEAFLTQIAKNGLLSDVGWLALVPMTIALRFPWLSEWLRKGDEEMISLETEYLALLVARATKLHTLWNSVH